MPATIQVMMPILGDAPAAIANVIKSGNATTEHKNPAFTSEKKSFPEYPCLKIKTSSGIQDFIKFFNL